MLHLARLSISKPKSMLAWWVVIAAGLIAVGLGVDSRLSPSVVVVPGTESSHAETLAQQEFGPSVLVPIMLQGPRIQLDAQGPKLVRDLARRSDTRVMSAWSASVGKTLRPKPTVAMIVASVARSEKAMVKTVQPQIDRIVRRDIGAPVRASVTGQPTIDRALRSEALNTTQRSELWAVAIIFLLCIFLLRSVLAAAVCAAFGVAVVFSAYGVDGDPGSCSYRSMPPPWHWAPCPGWPSAWPTRWRCSGVSGTKAEPPPIRPPRPGPPPPQS